MDPISILVGLIVGFVVGGVAFYFYGRNVVTRTLDLATKVEAQVAGRLEQLKKNQ